jgi:hypothetical protein
MRKEGDTKFKQAGHCQACMGMQMVRPHHGTHIMVLHGYRRPGRGYTIGSCRGVDEPPYELAIDLMVKIRGENIEDLKFNTKQFDVMKSGKVEWFKVDDRDKPIREEGGVGRYKRILGYEQKKVYRDSKSLLEQGEFERALAAMIWNLEQTMGSLIASIDMRTKLIDDWKIRPLKEWEAYEEELKRKGKPVEIDPDAGGLLVKMARKSKSVVPYDVLATAVRELGWKTESVVHLAKLTREYDERDVLSLLFKDFPGYQSMEGLRGVNDMGWVQFDSMSAAEEGLAMLRRKSVVIEKDPPKNPDPDKFYIREIGAVIPDAQGVHAQWVGMTVKLIPGFAIRYVWYPTAGFEFTSPKGETKTFAPIKEYYKGGYRSDIMPQGFWSWAYKLGLAEAADKYVKAHSGKSGELVDELGLAAEPPAKITTEYGS